MNRFRLMAWVFVGLLFPACSRSQNLGGPVGQPGYFSYRAPMGWTIQGYNLVGFAGCAGPRNNNFTPTIREVEYSTSGSLDDFVRSHPGGANYDPALQNAETGEQTSFSTNSGLKGLRAVFTYSIQNQNIERVLYFFHTGPNDVLVVTASCLAEDAARLAPVFDASIKSLTQLGSPSQSYTE